MAPRRGTTRRRFLKSTALAVAGLGLPRALGAATADLKLKKPIKIGCQTILSGPLGGYGEFMRKGATLAMEEINAQGGIGGRPIEISFPDEELKVGVGVKNDRAYLKRFKPDVEFVGESFAKFGTVDFSSHISKVMGLSPEGIFSTEWGGEAVTMVKQAKLFKVFEQTKAFMIGMGAAMDVLQGLGADYPDGVWASGRYYFGYPDSAENKRFNEAFRKRWDTYPSYPSETAYTAVQALKKAVEKARSVETEKVIEALEGLDLDRPAGKCVIRKEDHQAVYAVPWGQIRHDPKFPMPTLTNLKLFTTAEYYRNPPFAPVEG